ncbi:MAG: hypothetical protein LAP21_22885 [Acidobacteriia bacterium]|nr:hypothetical protein [Terriglobia bacterium]
MAADTYKAALKKAKNDLSAAIRQRDYWTIEIGRLQQLVKSLAASVEKRSPDVNTRRKKFSLNALVGVRFTDMVHSIVNSSEEGVSASDVKEQLQNRGYDFSEYSNPMALIHQTLKRLAKDGRITPKGNGKYEMNPMDYVLGGLLRNIGKP